VVSQRPEVRGLLWPSKLGLVLSLPRRILFIGPPDGAIARELGTLPQTAVFPPGAVPEVAQWLERQVLDSTPVALGDRRDPRSERERALAEWREWMIH
jgi:hypothetical protein